MPRSVPVGAGAGADRLARRDVDLRRATRLGLLGGVATVYVSAIGMVEKFSDREVVASLTLGRPLLLGIPLVAGYLAGRPPLKPEGFEPSRVGGRNAVAGLPAGAFSGGVTTVFMLLIDTFDVRDTFINITPALVRSGPRHLTFGHGLGLGITLLLALFTLTAGIGGALHVLPGRWRPAVIAGVVAVVVAALLQPLIFQVFRGLESEFSLPTAEVGDFLYQSSGALEHSRRGHRGGRDVTTEASAAERRSSPPILELRNVSTHYGPIQVLRDVSIEVYAGEIVCLLGGNASGKTTTLKTILGYVVPTHGDVLLDGQRVNGVPTQRLVEMGVSMVPRTAGSSSA